MSWSASTTCPATSFAIDGGLRICQEELVLHPLHHAEPTLAGHLAGDHALGMRFGDEPGEPPQIFERNLRLRNATAFQAFLRDFIRYENEVAAAIDRGITDLEAGHTRTTEEVFALLEQQRLARTRG